MPLPAKLQFQVPKYVTFPNVASRIWLKVRNAVTGREDVTVGNERAAAMHKCGTRKDEDLHEPWPVTLLRQVTAEYLKES